MDSNNKDYEQFLNEIKKLLKGKNVRQLNGVVDIIKNDIIPLCVNQDSE